MSISREHDFILADLAAVTCLLAQLDDEDVMVRAGLETRQNELKKIVSQFDNKVLSKPLIMNKSSILSWAEILIGTFFILTVAQIVYEIIKYFNLEFNSTIIFYCNVTIIVITTIIRFFLNQQFLKLRKKLNVF